MIGGFARAHGGERAEAKRQRDHEQRGERREDRRVLERPRDQRPDLRVRLPLGLSDGRVALFRPQDNWLRMNRSATRLAMPAIPEDLFMNGIAELVRADREWIPERDGGALYIRPVYFAID